MVLQDSKASPQNSWHIAGEFFLWVLYPACLAVSIDLYMSPTYWHLIAIGILITINAWVSFQWIWNRDGKAWHVFWLNIFQLILFTTVFRSLYVLGGSEYYSFARPPILEDWCQFTAVHVLRAADFMDAIEGYGWDIQNIKSIGYISGTAVVLLHLLVDFFLFSALYRLFTKKSFSRNLLRIITSIGTNLFIFGIVAVCVILLYRIKNYYIFFFWSLICGTMLWATSCWSTQEKDFNTKNWRGCADILLGCGCLVIILVLYLVGTLAGPFWALMLFLFCVFCTMLTIKTTFVFIPVVLFTILFGLCRWWIGIKYPDWFIGETNIPEFALENLFRAIDVLDMSQVYGWNWAGGDYQGWIFASVVVSYRFLASLFFYKYLYKLVILWGWGKAVPLDKKVDMLYDSDPDVRRAAELELKDSKDPKILPYILPLLREKENAFRVLALQLCQNVGDINTMYPVVQFLTEVKSKEIRDIASERYDLSDTCSLVYDNEVYGSVNFLKNLDRKEVIPYLVSRLKEEEGNGQLLLLCVLASLQAKEAIPDIVRLLQSPNKNARVMALETLGKLEAKEAIPSLIHFLSSCGIYEQKDVLRVLVKLNARESVPEIVNLLKNKNCQNRVLAINSLQNLTASEAIPSLVESLQSADKEERKAALNALVRLKGRGAVPEILRLVESKDAETRIAAMKALEKLDARRSILPLIPFLCKQEDAETGNLTGEILRPLGKEAIPLVKPLLFGEDRKSRITAMDILGKLKAMDTVADLITSLKDPDDAIRAATLRCLGEIGDRQAANAMLPFMNDTEIVASEATKALIKLGKLFCVSCGRSELTKQENGEYWCAWCQNWTRYSIRP